VTAILARFFGHVIFPLVAGVVSYVAWRTTEVRIVMWLPRGFSRALRETVGRIPMPEIVVGSLPDLAWAWAFGATLSLVWRGRAWRDKRLWLGAGAIFALGVEVGQAARVIPGTFDVVDLLAVGLGYVGGAVLVDRKQLDAPRPA
jgi:hypothetical protein